jgi:uncharacterized coiled-coil DUF342 family protein
MSWICPHCGYDNAIDPVNSRHTPLCKGCGEEYETAADVKKHITQEIKNHRTQIRDLVVEAADLRGEISSFQDEISSRKIKLADISKQSGDCKKELDMLEKKVIFGCDEETDRIEQRTARARLNRTQKTLPFEGVRLCA